MRPKRRRKYQSIWQKGFTLIEIIVIVSIFGIMGAVVAPSFTAMLDRIKVTQAVTNLQTTFRDSQRQAIQKNQICTVQIQQKSHIQSRNKIMGNCLISGSPEFPENINLATNIQSTVPAGSISLPPSFNDMEVKFGALGSADFSISSTVKPPLLPADPTGKVVAFIENSNIPKKCIAISSTLGLTRVGIYTGSTTPADITDQGICTALDWKQQ